MEEKIRREPDSDDDTLPSERKQQEALLAEIEAQRKMAKGASAAAKAGNAMNWGVLVKRVIAFLFDCVTLVAIGKALGFLFGEFLSSLGENGLWVGVGVATTYFTILDSSIGSGMTIGKRFFKIEVRQINGAMLNPFDAFLRFVPMAIVFSIAEFCLYADRHSPIILMLELVGAALAISIAVFAFVYPFNRTFADVMLNSVVVSNGTKIVPPSRRPHNIGTILLIALACVTALQGFRAWQISNSPDSRAVASITELLRRTIHRVDRIHIRLGKSEEGGDRVAGLRALYVNAMIPRKDDYDKATGIASHMKVAIESSGLLPDDVVYMDAVLKKGYDIGIANNIEDLSFNFPMLGRGKLPEVRTKSTQGKSQR